MKKTEIRIVTEHKKEYMPLLLLGDEMESNIEKYIERGELFALYDPDLKSVCVVTDEGGGTLEIQNLATDERYQRRGYASKLLNHIFDHYGNRYGRIILGTGDAPGILSFYARFGFAIIGREPDYFTKLFDYPIYEEGVMLRDRVLLEKDLRPTAFRIETEKLVRSLSGETTELLPFLPYLLQDFWELGGDPGLMAELIRKYAVISDKTRILDLACGKGAVPVKIAKKLHIKVKGIDLIPEFIEYARQKATEHNVDGLCEFLLGDINEAVKTEEGYDCVIYSAVGPEVLGGPSEALDKLKKTVKPEGFILIEDGYIPDDGKPEDVRFNRDAYLHLRQWVALFKEAGLELVETASGHSEGDLNNDTGLAAIMARADELIEKHPDKRALFEGYVRNQRDEYADIDDGLVCVTWVLKKA